MTDRAARPQSEDVSTALAEAPDRAPTFRDLYDAQFAYVWRTLRRLGARDADLEDLCHDVFVVVHRKLEQFEPGRPAKPWLFGIALRVASDYRKRARFRAEVPADGQEAVAAGPGADEHVAAAEARALVHLALQELDLERRAVFVLHDLDECAAPEIAEALGVPVNTVYSRLRAARSQLTAAVRRLQLRGGAR